MSRLLFRLRHVPEDEADEVRQLLLDNELEFFETSPGNWGISMPGLWLQDESRFDEARALIDNYQEQRLSRVREEFRRQQEAGEGSSFWTVFRESPLRFLSYVGLIVVVLYLSLSYFLGFL